MARGGTQEEQRSWIIRPADAQMFVLVAARVETDYGLGDGRARQGRDIAANQCAGIGALTESASCR
jgi:hypothetical protein